MEPHEERFARQHPDLFFLRGDNLPELEDYLRRQALLGKTERVVSVTRAGEGNMNCTLRVRTNRRSLIVKQSRPWVQKYPQIDAPWDRVLSEARFYMLTSPCEGISQWMPKLVELDPAARVLVLEDVGEACDFTGVYRGDSLSAETVEKLADWLSALHALHHPAPSRRSLKNRDMRALNHAHIFEIPLERDNGIDLEVITSGLSRVARQMADSAGYVARVHKLGNLYLTDGPSLLHGDFFPGSWLATPHGAIVIDPEFAFFGRPEFDVGVFLAHLHLSGQQADVFESVYSAYQPAGDFDWALAIGFAGCEIMRRLIGVAQLPLPGDLEQKRELLDLSHNFVLSPRECLPLGVRATAG